MNKPNPKRFAAWTVLVSLGWLSFLWIDHIGGLFFLASYFVAMPRDELHRVVPRRELLSIIVVLIAFVVLSVALKLLTPASTDRALNHFFRHPAVIITLWLLCLWLGFRGWRRKVHQMRAIA